MKKPTMVDMVEPGTVDDGWSLRKVMAEGMKPLFIPLKAGPL